MDLNASVRGVEPMLRRLIEEHIGLSLVLDPGIGMVRADPGQIDQILVNLVVNARDAMPCGGTVTVATGRAEFDERDAIDHFEATPGRYVLLAVSDTGVGMDPETREHVFEPFFTTKEVGKGTGLGLATIYGIVHQLGGHIWLYSEPGQGSTFKLYFPEHDAPLEEIRTRVRAPLSGRRGTVMVVEDEGSVRDMIVRLLDRAGYTVEAAGDGMAALARLTECDGHIDVLVTDVVLPTMSGVALAERVIERYPSIGLVLVSGYLAETLDLSFVIDHGASFVSKPVASRDFLAVVDEAMEAASVAALDQALQLGDESRGRSPIDDVVIEHRDRGGERRPGEPGHAT